MSATPTFTTTGPAAPEPFAYRAARMSVMAWTTALATSAVQHFLLPETTAVVVAVAAARLALYSVGTALGGYALLRVRQLGPVGILIPATAGLILCYLSLMISVGIVIHAWRTRNGAPPAATATAATQPADAVTPDNRGRVDVTGPR